LLIIIFIVLHRIKLNYCVCDIMILIPICGETIDACGLLKVYQ